MSGNFIPSRTKKTGKLFPTRSKFPFRQKKVLLGKHIDAQFKSSLFQASEEERTKSNLSCIKLDRKTPRVSKCFWAATFVNNSREADNHGRLNSGSPKEVSTCQTRNIMCDLEESLCAGSPSMHDTLRNPLSIKVGQLFQQMIILKENWTWHNKKQIYPNFIVPCHRYVNRYSRTTPVQPSSSQL